MRSRFSLDLRSGLCGALALLFILCLTVVPLLGMMVSAGTIAWSDIIADVYIQRVVGFSLYQAFLSAALSLLLALPVALALSHRRVFIGRSWVVMLMSLSLVIPTIVAIYGIVAVFGRVGWISTWLAFLGLDPLPFYGLPGILIAHVFFNMPLAARVLLQSLESIPDNHWRLARQLGMRPWALWRYIEWPCVASQLPGLFLLIFTLCLTSFTIVMTLGGGPRATTIEVAVYQALRFDFDLTMAVALACIQLGLCLVLTALSTLFKARHDIGFEGARSLSMNRSVNQPLGSLWSSTWLVVTEGLIVVVASLFIVLPLSALFGSALNEKTLAVLLASSTITALVNTCITALCSACIAVVLATGLLVAARDLRIRLHHERIGQWLQLSGNMILVLPPVVLGVGLFLILRPYADVFSLALLLVVLINSLMALPFVLRIMEAPVMRAAKTHDPLLRALGVRGLNRLRLIDWPLLRGPLGLSFALATTLSAGDFSAIALFGSERVTTLPLLLFERMGSYRLQEAAATAGLLLMLCLVLFVVLQRVIGGRSDAGY